MSNMCAINPKHKKRMILDFYTSHPQMTRKKFEEYVYKWSLKTEQTINTLSPSIRVHVKETEQEAE